MTLFVCARTVVEPICIACATPALLIMATFGCVELHATVALMSCVLPSLNVAIAWSWRLLPMSIDTVDGTMFNAVTTGAVTFRLADPAIDPELTLTVVVPMAFATTLPAADTVAVAGAADIQVADWLRFCVLPSV